MITWIFSFLFAFSAFLWLVAMTAWFGIGGTIFFGLIPSLLFVNLSQHLYADFSRGRR